MDKLDQYLDQVCRRIAGPRALRQHVRQELREHLQDAVAEHRAAGLTEEAALARALEDFGKPEEVRSELEAAHGHSLLAVVIDKALEWKEMTMKAKWLWTSWANLAVMGVLALEVLFITFNVLFIVPKFQKLMLDGIIDPAIIDEQGMSWMPSFLNTLKHVGGHYTLWLALLAAAACGLFEWRVRSENKPFMRLAALGTAAVGLMMVVALMAGALAISFTLGAPALGRLARPFAQEQIAGIDAAIAPIDKVLAKRGKDLMVIADKDWEQLQTHAVEAAQALSRLAHGPALTSLTAWNEPQKVEELRAHLKTATESITEAQLAVRDKDDSRLEAALRHFHKAYEPIREAAKKPAR